MRGTVTLFPGVVAVLLCIGVCPVSVHAWWEATHVRVVNEAVRIVPAPLNAYFSQYTNDFAAHAGDSDKLRHTRKHSKDWFDLEGVSTYPFTDIPVDRSVADSLYGKTVLEKDMGILPWNVVDEFRIMVEGFKTGNYDRTVRTAVHLAHHIADAHMPLHTTLNYNGVPVGRKGVHGRIEAACEDLLARVPVDRALKPSVVDDPFTLIMNVLRRSNGRVFPLLYTDAAAHECGLVKDPSLKRGKPEYEAYILEKLNGMFGLCLNEAAAVTAGLWTAAWEKAGKPALPAGPVPLTWEIDAKGAEDE